MACDAVNAAIAAVPVMTKSLRERSGMMLSLNERRGVKRAENKRRSPNAWFCLSQQAWLCA
ncbi:hypothetical protein MesoLjLb_57580 [Mesorhizobium sp. L-8-3]|nr:hypothetical protein MesoLjLb_57580 [Mesorhizobium sp. L-8-3]